jgi:hypothetical protein
MKKKIPHALLKFAYIFWMAIFFSFNLQGIEIKVVQEPSCGEDNGIIKVEAKQPFKPGTSYNWSNDESTQTISNLPTGNYKVTVTDPEGCTAEAEIELESELKVTIIGQSTRVCKKPCPPECPIAPSPCPQPPPFSCKITLTANVTNCPGCTFLWSNGSTLRSAIFEFGGSASPTVSVVVTRPSDDCNASASKKLNVKVNNPRDCNDENNCRIIRHCSCRPCIIPPPPPPCPPGDPCCVPCNPPPCYTCRAVTCPCITGIASMDPNDIIGPDGYESWVSVNERLNYIIRYENDPIFATSAAQTVRVVHPIPPEINIFSFRLGDFGFGQHNFTVPANTVHYSTQLDLSDELGVLVDVLAGIDVVNREAFWILESKDPVTGLEPPAGVGFLPINDTLVSDPDNFIFGPGEGFVNFSVKPDINVAETFDTLIALADIFFDQNEPVRTPDWVNIIDADHPITAADAVNIAVDTPLFEITWTGSDFGIGLSHTALYVSINGGVFELVTDTLTGNSMYYTGQYGSSYDFFTQGIDLVGNIEPLKLVSEAAFFVNGTLQLIEPDISEACQGTFVPVSWTFLGLEYLDIWLIHESGDSSLMYLLHDNHPAEDSVITVMIPPELTVAGNYFIILDGRNSFLADTSQAIEILPILITPMLEIPPICRGEDIDLADFVSFSGGLDSLSFLWSGQFIIQTGAIEATASPTFSQYYILEITDTRGCTARDSIFIEVNQLPAVISQKSDVLCGGQPQGSINLSLSGNEPFQVMWNDGVSEQLQRTNLVPGFYTVTVTDNNGCSRVRTIQVLDLNPFNYSAGGDQVLCPGDTIQLGSGPELNGGSPPHTFYWTSTDPGFSDTAVLDPVVVPVNDQSYVLHITDSLGCVYTDTAMVLIGSTPVLNVVTTEISCFLGSNGSISIIPTGNDGPWTYEWNNLDTTQTRNNLNAGVYQVTVTNGLGCTSGTSITLVNPPVLQAVMPTNLEICAGDTILLSGGAAVISGGFPPYNASWSENYNLISSNILDALAYPETDTAYLLQLTDASSCTSTLVVNVQVRERPELTADLTMLACDGEPTGSIALTPAGLPPFDILWNDGDTALMKTGLDAGIYSVQIADGNFSADGNICVNSYSFEIIPTATADTLAVFTTTCNEADTGFYYVSLTNQFGCDSIIAMTVDYAEVDSVFFFETTCVSSEAGVFVDEFINQFGCDSIVTTTIDFAQSYEIFLTDIVCDQSEAGTFVQSLSTQFGCDSIVTTTLTWAGDSIAVSAESCIQADAGIVTETYINQAGCDSVVIITTSFVPQWETEETLFTCHESETGVFELVLTAGGGCDSLVTQTVVLYEIEEAEIGNLSETYCSNEAGISLTVFPSGGTLSGPGVTGLTFNPQTAGTGTHTIVYEAVDVNGCEVSTEAIVEVLDVPEVSVSLANEGYCPYTEQVDISVSPQGGTVSGTAVDGLIFNPSQAGPGNFALVYAFEAANGCIATDTFMIEVYEPTQSTLTGLSETYCDNDPTAQITPNPAGGLLSGPGISNLNFNPANANLGNNELSYEFTDGFGCTYTHIYNVEVFEAPIVNLGADTTIAEGDSLLLDAGNPGAWYLWTTTETTQQIFISETGTYGVTVTDDNGCSNFDEVTVEVLVWVNDPNLLNALTIFPNPTTGQFQVEFTLENARKIQIEIFDPSGRKVSYQTLDFNTSGTYTVPCDIGHMPSGSYFIRITAEDSHITTQPVLKVNDK